MSILTPPPLPPSPPEADNEAGPTGRHDAKRADDTAAKVAARTDPAAGPALSAAPEPEQAPASAPAPATLINHDELVDLRALQRTFDGAYTRTALAQLSYAILILRLFERDFYWCGLVYTLLAVQLVGVATYRYNLAVSNQDRWKTVELTAIETEPQAPRAQPDDGAHTAIDDPALPLPHQEQAGHGGTSKNGGGSSGSGGGMSHPVTPAAYSDAIHVPLFRQTFRTAGTVVAIATACTLTLELVLAALVLAM